MKRIVVSICALALLLSSCADNSEYAAKVGGKKISSDELKFYLSSVKSQMAGTELSNDEDWQTKEIEGRKAIDLARERALDTAVDNLAYIEVGKALGIKLTSDDKKKMESYKNQFVSQSGGSASYKEYLAANGIKDSFIDMLCESMIYSGKLTDKLVSEQPVTDEEVSAYYEENKDDLNTTYRHAKHILILTRNMTNREEMSEEEQNAAKEKADGIYKRALAGEDFDALVAEFSEDPGSKSQPDGYVFGDGEMDTDFQNKTDELKPGEIGMVKSYFGYHIIKRLPLEEKDVADKIKSQLISDKLSEQMDVWESENNIAVEINDEAVAKVE